MVPPNKRKRKRPKIKYELEESSEEGRVPEKRLKISKFDPNAYFMRMTETFNDESLSDVVILHKTKKIHVQRAILSSHSSVLKEIFYPTNQRPHIKRIEQEGQIHIYINDKKQFILKENQLEFKGDQFDDLSYENMTSILLYFYQNQLLINRKNAIPYYMIASLLEITDLKERCTQTIATFAQMDNIGDIIQFAEKHHEPQVLQRCIELMTLAVMKTECFLNLPLNTVIRILSSNDLGLSENDVLQGIQEYMAFNNEKLKLEEKQQLMGCVRLARLSGNSIITLLRPLVKSKLISLEAYTVVLEYFQEKEAVDTSKYPELFKTRLGGSPWSSALLHKHIKIDGNKIYKKKGDGEATVLSNKVVTSGCHYWEVEILGHEGSGRIGVANPNTFTNFSRHVGSGSDSYGIWKHDSTLYTVHLYNYIHHGTIKHGDRIGIYLDLNNNVLKLSVNKKELQRYDNVHGPLCLAGTIRHQTISMLVTKQLEGQFTCS